MAGQTYLALQEHQKQEIIIIKNRSNLLADQFNLFELGLVTNIIRMFAWLHIAELFTAMHTFDVHRFIEYDAI